jgi:hypothetical protein|tara:strand:+ start:101 stop:646 length:546 start_codon:yes stop_codon:yes gene_type:complete
MAELLHVSGSPGNISGSIISTGSFGKLIGEGGDISGITTFGGSDGSETAFSGSSASTGSFGSLVVSDKVQGTLTVAGNTTLQSDLTVEGTIYETSTERFKTNIKTVDGQLNNVLKLRGVSFNKYNSPRKEIGLIAEDVNEIYPEFVSNDKSSVNYGKMIAVLVEAIRELNDKVDALTKQKK